MDDAELFCPQCGSTFPWNDGVSGGTLQCPSCSAELEVKSDLEGGLVAHLPPGKARPRPEVIPVTSGTSAGPHEVVGMVCVCLGTRGGMASQFNYLKQVLASRLSPVRKGISPEASLGQFIGGVGIDSDGDVGVAGNYAGASFASNDPEIAFHIAVNQLQLRASFLGATKVVSFRYDLNLDSNSGVLNFLAVAYGTAIRELQ